MLLGCLVLRRNTIPPRRDGLCSNGSSCTVMYESLTAVFPQARFSELPQPSHGTAPMASESDGFHASIDSCHGATEPGRVGPQTQARRIRWQVNEELTKLSQQQFVIRVLACTDAEDAMGAKSPE